MTTDWKINGPKKASELKRVFSLAMQSAKQLYHPCFTTVINELTLTCHACQAG